MNSRVLAVRVRESEWNAWQQLCEANGCTTQDMLHAVLVDALADEGLYGLRRRQSEGHSGSGEESEGNGAATP